MHKVISFLAVDKPAIADSLNVTVQDNNINLLIISFFNLNFRRLGILMASRAYCSKTRSVDFLTTQSAVLEATSITQVDQSDLRQ
jgi:hypothetical protein